MAQKRLTAFFTDKKYRPWLIGGLVVIGLVFLLALMGRRGSSAGASTGPSEAMHAKMLEAQLAGAQIQAALGAEQIRASVEMAQTTAALRAAELQHVSDLEQIQATERLQSQAVEASRQVSMYETQAALERDAIREQAAVRVAEIAGATQQYLMQQTAAIQIGAMEADYAKEAARIAGQVQLADIQYSAARDVKIAEQQTVQHAINKAKKRHVASIVGGSDAPGFGGQFLGGLTGALISDLRVKEDIQWTGESDGLNWYEYRERNIFCKGQKKQGLMAQEIPAKYTSYVNASRPWIGVDYHAVMRDSRAISDTVM